MNLISPSKTERASFRRPVATILKFGLVMTLSVVIVSGCSSRFSSASAASPVVSATHADAHAAACLAPLRIAYIDDKSASTGPNRVQHVDEGSLDPLINLVASRGGELELIVIRDRTDETPDVRLRVNLKPIEPPTKPSTNENAFQLSIDTTHFRAEEQSYHEAVKARSAEVKNWVQVFKNNIAPILARPANAHTSAVCDAFRRAHLFLAEPSDNWWAKPHEYVLAVTDGKDTTGKTHCQPLNGHTLVLLVNGTGSVGVLRALNPLQFESVSAANDYIISREEMH